MSTLAYRPRTSEEVKPIPEAYFEALFVVRLCYKNHSATQRWNPPYTIEESPPLGSWEWMHKPGDEVSRRWRDYKHALDSLLDNVEEQVRYLKYLRCSYKKLISCNADKHFSRVAA